MTSYSTHMYGLWANMWCSIILWYYPRCQLHSKPHKDTLWATIATHLWPKIAKNCWKFLFLVMFTSIFYTQICSIGQWVVSNYIMIPPKAPLTLMTPYSYPMGHYSHSFVSKNGQKWFNHLRPFSLTNKWLWCPIEYSFWVMSVIGTLGDSIEHLNTTCWPREQICVWKKRLCR